LYIALPEVFKAFSPKAVESIKDYLILLVRRYDILARSKYPNAPQVPQYVFRGESKFYPTYAIPAILRPNDKKRDFTSFSNNSRIRKVECKEIRQFQEQNQSKFSYDSEAPIWIALTQHYGGKTRLLDVTEDPLVALFFACWKFKNNDSKPWDESTEGLVYIFPSGQFRIQTIRRDIIEKLIDIKFLERIFAHFEHGIPSKFTKFFEDWTPNQTYKSISLGQLSRVKAILYRPLETDIELNNRIYKQDSWFLWWHPIEAIGIGAQGKLIRNILTGHVHDIISDVHVIRIKGSVKEDILRELNRMKRYQPSSLFPDKMGEYMQQRLEKHLP